MNAVVLLGPPGAGKGTAAEVLVGKGYIHVSTGDLLRAQIRLETPLGLEAKKLMDRGRFVPDDVVVEMIRNFIADSGTASNYLFDGFPRTLVQAEQLDALLEELGGKLDAVVLMECPEDTIVERLSGRRTCSKCGAVYHMVYNPPANGSTCDVNGCALMQRPDDKAETVRKRLHVYEEQTAPLIGFYGNRSLIKRVDASRSIEEVRQSVLEILEPASK